jgi:hypothetical protein
MVGIDIRLPLGILFSLLGVILAVYGLLGDSSLYQKSLGIDINLFWGIALLAFGAVMLLLGRRGVRAARPVTDATDSTARGH